MLSVSLEIGSWFFSCVYFWGIEEIFFILININGKIWMVWVLLKIKVFIDSVYY